MYLKIVFPSLLQQFWKCLKWLNPYVQVIGVWWWVFWLKVCIYSHTRGVKLGLGLGFMQTSQVLPHWLNQSFSFWTLPYTQRHCHVRIEKQGSRLILPTGRTCATNFLSWSHEHIIRSQFFFWYNIWSINACLLTFIIFYSYMVTKVFNIRPVLFHQYHLWFKFCDRNSFFCFHFHNLGVTLYKKR